jgi:hypothetical protein
MDHNYDKTSDLSDISIQTDLKVFQGGLGLNKGGINKNYSTSNTNIISNAGNNAKLLNNMFFNQKPNYENAHGNIHDGLISFRSKKGVNALKGDENFSIVTGNNDETVDTITLTKKIIDKIGNLKVTTKKKESTKIANQAMAEDEIINKVFHKPEYELENQEDEKELKNFDLNNSINENENDIHEVDENEEIEFLDDSHGDENLENLEISENFDTNNHNTLNNKMEDEKNIFWNLKKNIDIVDSNISNAAKARSKSVFEKKLKYVDVKETTSNSNTISNRSKKSSTRRIEKEIYLNSIICTLSRIEKGKAIFVSNDDYIFVLPASFVPRNLIVGNTYIFRISEFEKFKDKVINLQEIRKKYNKNNEGLKNYK